MTTRTHRKIVTTKRFLAVVTSHATKSASRGVMIEGDGRSYFSALARTNLMAIKTFRPVVIVVTEPSSKSDSARRRPHERLRPVANSTRRNIAPVRLRLRRVAAKTCVVRTEPGRNRESHTTIERPVTTTAPGIRMQRMIEPAAETSQRRKCLYCLTICMADRANRTRATGKQRLMTTNTRCVFIFSGQRWLRGIGLTPVTQQARQPRVIRIVVVELRVVFAASLRED